MRWVFALSILALSAFLAFRQDLASPAEARLGEIVRAERLRRDPPLDETAGHRFGRVALDENGAPFENKDGKSRFAYYAVPKTYAGQRTCLVGEEGRIYAKDTKGEAPRAWPASDPTAKGWVACGE